MDFATKSRKKTAHTPLRLISRRLYVIPQNKSSTRTWITKSIHGPGADGDVLDDAMRFHARAEYRRRERGGDHRTDSTSRQVGKFTFILAKLIPYLVYSDSSKPTPGRFGLLPGFSTDQVIGRKHRHHLRGCRACTDSSPPLWAPMDFFEPFRHDVAGRPSWDI